ncbi:catalase, partial [Bacillus sp. D-CC]
MLARPCNILSSDNSAPSSKIEKVAFSPSNLLDGAELSDDKMLQGRANPQSVEMVLNHFIHNP